MAVRESRIEIVANDPAWPAAFEVEAARLHDALGAYAQAKTDFIERVLDVALVRGDGRDVGTT